MDAIKILRDDVRSGWKHASSRCPAGSSGRQAAARVVSSNRRLADILAPGGQRWINTPAVTCATRFVVPTSRSFRFSKQGIDELNVPKRWSRSYCQVVGNRAQASATHDDDLYAFMHSLAMAFRSPFRRRPFPQLQKKSLSRSAPSKAHRFG